MTRDELEFAISQYLDGSLAEPQQSALEERLAGDPDARAVLAEYRTLDRVLRSAPGPEIDFESMADRIRTAVYREPAPVQSYRLEWFRTASALALAACVVIAAAVGIRRMTTGDRRGDAPVVSVPTWPEAVARHIVVVDSTTRPAVSTAPVAVASVGPSAALQESPALAGYDEDLLSRPSQVIIARGGYAAQDASTQDGLLLP